SQRKIETLGYTYQASTGLVSKEDRTAWRTAADPTLFASPGQEENPDFSQHPDIEHDTHAQLTRFGPETFAYDASGNRTAQGLVYGPGNRLLSDTVWDYSYDNEGNLTQKVRRSDGRTWQYGYDHLNRLLSVREWLGTPGQTQQLTDVAYSYDGLGRLV